MSAIPIIDIIVEAKAWNDLPRVDDLSREAVAACMAETGESLGPEAELSLFLCDDARIRELNKSWRGIDKPTNVLSFPTADEGGDILLGDIVIAYETVEREAREQAIGVADHYAHMVVHGFLHLRGYDHEDDSEAEVMEDLERRALARLGLADPYASDGDKIASDER
jgi:probable rRNA maturation factor